MIDMPEDFYSEYSGLPFDTCIDCGASLLEGDVPYVILKNVVARETVFEMAICLTCVGQLQREYSEESRQAIEAWLDARIQSIAQPITEPDNSETSTLWEDVVAKPPMDIDRCRFCGTPRGDSHRYCMEAVCIGRQMVQVSDPSRTLSFPLLVCETCTGDVSEVISKKTRDQWNRFVEDHFDGPPGIELDPVDSDLMFI
ncbi:MAG: hypothetical protein KDA93_12035 [Planctomycetaceae bacterium]|nr:hypothetical protein [Planctomycetaceae bacterium]